MPKNAPGIPAGDYATSCAGCSLAADILTCSHCEKPCGTRVLSTLDVTSCGDAAITNKAGVLACKEALPANAADVPECSYLGSCPGCSLAGAVLSCSACLDGAGKAHASSLDVGDCLNVGNNQGALECVQAGRRASEAAEAAPAGDAPTSGTPPKQHDEL